MLVSLVDRLSRPEGRKLLVAVHCGPPYACPRSPARANIATVMATRPIAALLLLLSVVGCGSDQQLNQKHESPRPVRVFTLYASSPATSEQMTGSVDAWKTERIGFEVTGRVRWVIEPEQEIEGRTLDRSGTKVLTPGSVLAQLDDERYRFAVESAAAAVDQVKLQKQTVEIEIASTLPARIQAAKADEKLAQIELGRAQRLAAQNAGPRAEFERAQATFATATSQVATLEANLKAKQAELRSLDAQIKQAEQALAEAQRNLKDCSLYSSFRGQTAQVHVVPGSVVTQGAPVVTVQMMDPMKVEVEVSPAVSRRLQHGETIRLHTSDAYGEAVALPGFVYMTDPLADPQTRTFTVTILTRNRRLRLPVPAEMQGQAIARTSDVMPVNLDFVGGGESRLVEVRAIHRDDHGPFLWRVKNRKFNQVTLGASPILEVEKVPVLLGDVSIPFLGNWNFVPVTFPEGVNFDVEKDMVAGELFVDDGDAESWSGDRILFDQERWLLRPGDLVRVDLGADQSEPGLYVPMRAIRHESGRTFVFVVDQGTTPPRARQVEVRFTGSSGGNGHRSLQKIDPIDAELPDGSKIVVEGVHFLHDGEPIAEADQEVPR